jgi:ABC-2 type transport system permease protein
MTARLFRPWLLGNLNRFFPGQKVGLRALSIFGLGLVVCLIIYLATLRVLTYFHSQNELGVILSLKIFQMAWITIFAMLIFSSMVTAVSTLYLSSDNEIIIAAPLRPDEIYLMRYLTTTLATSWMVLVFSLPVFGAYARVFQAGPLFWPLLLLAVPAMALIASAAAMLATVVLVYFFPARRTKDIILYLSLLFGILLYLIFRLMRPEDLVNPDRYGEFIEYFSAISAPAGPWLPAGWSANLLGTYLLDGRVDWLLAGLLVTTPLVLYFAGELAMRRWFIAGFSKSQESFGGHMRFAPTRKFPNLWVWIWRKELKYFLRDSSEWSQLFMVGALIVVYLYNFKVLPLDRAPMRTEYLTHLIAFANIGLVGFIAASLAARFVYPSLSSERGAFYLIASAPLPLSRFLLYKYLFYLPPFTLLTLILVVVSNHLLGIHGPMLWISLFLSLLTTWTTVALALLFGLYFADFKSENRAAAMGPGAILFLFCAVLYQLSLIGLGLLPIFHLIRGWLRTSTIPPTDLVLLCLWGSGAVFVSLLLVFIIFRRALLTLTK